MLSMVARAYEEYVNEALGSEGAAFTWMCMNVCMYGFVCMYICMLSMVARTYDECVHEALGCTCVCVYECMYK